MQYSIVWENGSGWLSLFADGDEEDFGRLLAESVGELGTGPVRSLLLPDLKRVLVTNSPALRELRTEISRKKPFPEFHPICFLPESLGDNTRLKRLDYIVM